MSVQIGMQIKSAVDETNRYAFACIPRVGIEPETGREYDKVIRAFDGKMRTGFRQHPLFDHDGCVIVIDTAAANAILFAPRRILFLYFFQYFFLAVDVETVVQPVDRIPAQRAYDGI